MKKLIITIAALVPKVHLGNAIFHLIIAIILISASSANAQLYKGFGVKVGTSIANQNFINTSTSIIVGLEGDPNNDYRYKFGFTCGVFKEFTLSPNFKSQIAINYVRKGSIMNSVYNQSVSYVHDNVDFLSTELFGKYCILKSKFTPYALLGLRVDFFLSRNVFRREASGKETNLGSPSINNNVIYGASLGAGAEYRVSKQFSLFLEGTYNPDFTNILSEVQNIRGHSFDIRTGIKF